MFTGGGSEADNLAVKGAAWAARDRRRGADGVVTTGDRAQGGARRRATGSSARASGSRGSGADADGVRRPRRARRRARRAHRGRVGDAREQRDRHRAAARRGRASSCATARRGAVVHTDAVQAPRGSTSRRAAAGVDLRQRSPGTSSAARRVSARSSSATASSSCPLVEGGGHEGERRAGHPERRRDRRPRRGARASPHEQRAEECARIAALRDRLEAGLAARVAGLRVSTATPARRVAGHPALHVRRASRPRRCSSRSTSAACTRRRARRAPRARSIRRTCCSRWGSRAERARSSVRFSLGYATTDADIDAALAVVPDAVRRLVGAAA